MPEYYTIFIFIHIIIVGSRVVFLKFYGPSSIIFIGIFEVLFSLPIYLDIIFGEPLYLSFPGLSGFYLDLDVNIAYIFSVLMVDIILSIGLIQRRLTTKINIVPQKISIIPIILAAYLPIIMIIIGGYSSLFLEFGNFSLNHNIYNYGFISFLPTFISISFLAISIYFFAQINTSLKGRNLLLDLFVAAAGVLDIWILGKRSIIAFALLTVGLYLLTGKHGRSRHKAMVTMLLIFASVIAMSQFYQTSVRPETQQDAIVAYDNFRIDMGRDHDLKLALSREVDEVLPSILEYRGQTFLFDATIAVPRDLWPDKPWPYAVYATDAALSAKLVNPNWGLTTSLLSESVANMGLIGLFVAVLFFIVCLRAMDRSDDPIFRLLGTLSTCGLLVVQFSALAVWHVLFFGYATYRIATKILRSSRVRATYTIH